MKIDDEMYSRVTGLAPAPEGWTWTVDPAASSDRLRLWSEWGTMQARERACVYPNGEWHAYLGHRPGAADGPATLHTAGALSWRPWCRPGREGILRSDVESEELLLAGMQAVLGAFGFWCAEVERIDPERVEPGADPVAELRSEVAALRAELALVVERADEACDRAKATERVASMARGCMLSHDTTLARLTVRVTALEAARGEVTPTEQHIGHVVEAPDVGCRWLRARLPEVKAQRDEAMRELSEQRAKSWRACQIIAEAIGASGPLDVEEVAQQIVKRFEVALRERDEARLDALQCAIAPLESD